MATELELKLMVHPTCFDKAVQALDAFCVKEVNAIRQPTLNLMNGYYDTQDALLMSSGIALRVRSVNEEYIQTLKTRGVSRVGMHARGEWEWNVPTDALDFELITPDMLPSNLHNKEWQSKIGIVYRTDFERQIWLIDFAGSKIEVVCDRGEVTSPYGHDGISEIEFELKQGDETSLYQAALSLAQQVPLQVCTVSKAQRGVRLKTPIIELPDDLPEDAQHFQIGAYWYEVWLTYWEAMVHREDDSLYQEIETALLNLQNYLPNELSGKIAYLLTIPERLLDPEKPLFLSLSQDTQMGVSMLEIGRWLNLQH
ncbi:CYTH domain-containing protein [Marinomonas sp. 15G1-11]|uniref:CYTH domain-containing protein n=1 Tax=Marinomonas phaeophyticola TaxID=3004091 RepID=A0ABT4JR26_9GAMM|nr:CYTH domain-containing protein [Marinomonas sp. 15G1-11]MCZ2720833.1 CYTH domain-containing protein [Marinomonas sp. 15G1-11]